MAMTTFSSVVSSGNTRATWNDRPKPRRTRFHSGIRVTSCPSKRTVPESAKTSPLSTLNRVVLPAPLGPMTAKVSPSATATSTPFRTFTDG